MKVQKVYFENLDAIRFLAASMVVLQHAVSPAYEYLPVKDTFLRKILMLCSNGALGVTIFFVLSGFLITYLLIAEYEATAKIAVGNFYMRRVLRIWPLYYTVLLIAFGYPVIKQLLHMDHPLASNIYYHLMFLSNFDLIHAHTAHPDISNLAGSQSITWSVSVEEQFYLFWPLLFVWLPRKIWGYAILVLALMSIGFRMMHYSDKNILYFHTLSVVFDLAIGAAMAYLIYTYASVRTFFQNTSTGFHVTIALIILSMVYWYELIFHFEYGLALERVVISFFIALFIAAQAMTTSVSFMNLKNLSFASRWGKYTYGIYLIHPIMITIIAVLIKIMDVPQDRFLPVFGAGMLICLLTLIVSKLSYTYLEKPFLKLKERFS